MKILGVVFIIISIVAAIIASKLQGRTMMIFIIISVVFGLSGVGVIFKNEKGK
ncbi:hypothetical protein [Clostridium felsineum]|uniref:hypothetical protein n=1 Tax=Clostridium felsineum TaxID=36839 RepID=UPI0009CAD928|nr:hypothetical protein [Clostridium felsineum]URZ17222.1 hypothetical protein CLFE_032750 [Clostridium felsineum DSM 794]